MIQLLLALCISFLASCIGAICGIGGGVIIKPVMDAVGVATVNEVSFLSGCTVLSMSCYSVGISLLKKENNGSVISLEITGPLSVGAVVSGIVGKMVFLDLILGVNHPDLVGCIQSICLFVLTFGTMMYTIKKKKIRQQQFYGKVI